MLNLREIAMFLNRLPNEIALKIATELDKKDISNISCLNKYHYQLFQPILTQRKQDALVKVYICHKLHFISHDKDAYDAKYFDLAAKTLNQGKLFVNYDDAFRAQLRGGVLFAAYVAAIPFKCLNINTAGNIALKNSYQFTIHDIEGIYLAHLNEPNNYQQNPVFNKEAKNLFPFLESSSFSTLRHPENAVNPKYDNLKKSTCILL